MNDLKREAFRDQARLEASRERLADCLAQETERYHEAVRRILESAAPIIEPEASAHPQD